MVEGLSRATWKSVITDTFRLLTFRITRDELLLFDKRHLIFGVVCTWIVGMGRYWDDPRAHLLQHVGTGSVIYVFALALLLWVIVAPLRPAHWSYFHVCTFVSLVSPPALLYAIPVERFFSLGTATTLNVWFLGVVAAWRVALLVFFLKRFALLGTFSVIVVTLLPLAAIVISLTALNLERAVFDVMGGLRQGTANDGAYAVLLLLTLLSFLLSVPLTACYIALVVASQRRSRDVNRIIP